MYRRALAPSILTSLSDTPVLFLVGARQTGKSTLMQTLLGAGADPATFRTLDDLGTLAAAKGDPEAFIAGLGDRVVLDEVQRAPELLLAIKAAVDRNRQPGRFALTGSANVMTLPRVSESLAGRMEVLTLWPLAQAEMEGSEAGFVDACFRGKAQDLVLASLDRADLVNRVLLGGYPEVVARTTVEARTRWFEAYLATMIQRDLRDLAAIEGMIQLPRLFQGVAARVGATMNVADLGRTIGLNQVTLKRYLGLLETLYLVKVLPPWFENLSSRLAKTPKFYLNDSGLLAHVLGLEAEALERQPALFGPLLKNFVVMELTKMAGCSKVRPGLSHLRTSGGIEVDVILENRRREVVGIEVKAATTLGEADFRGLRFLKSELGERMRCGIVLYSGREPLPFGNGLWALPIQALWGSAAVSRP
jgi:predicted AAA+ superfamily ATPase